MKSLSEFLESPVPNRRMLSADVSHPGFLRLYVRRGLFHLFDGPTGHEEIPDCFVVACVASDRPGSGEFGRLLDSLTGRTVVVENAHEPRFQDYLLRRGFQRANFAHGPSFMRRGVARPRTAPVA